MSASRRSNPVDYKLPLMKSWDGRPAAFKPYQKRVKLICESFMRRLKAAYKRGVTHADTAFYVGGTAKQYWLSAIAQEAVELEEGINKLYTMVMEYLTSDRLGWGSPYETRNAVDVANSYIRHANDVLMRGHKSVRGFEAAALSKLRGSQSYYEKPTHREHVLRVTKREREFTRKMYLILRQQYPYIREKNRKRLMRVAMHQIEAGNKPGYFRERAVTMTDLMKAGIPAVDIVGPWWPKTPDIKSPADYIDYMDRHSDIRLLNDPSTTRALGDFESPAVDDWLHIVGLDGGDRELREACMQYYLRNKAAPSVKWAQERSNQLDAERAKKEIEGSIPEVTKWLKYSKVWRDKGKVIIPILPGPEWKVLEPQDARKLCETAKRDGLCVVDVIEGFIDPDPYDHDDEETAQRIKNDDPRDGALSSDLLNYCNDEGVCTLILCTDPKRRTVVGLDKDGNCTSEHHATGVQNKVDKAAWEYFRAKK